MKHTVMALALGLAMALLAECCATVLDSPPDEEFDRQALFPVDSR